MAERVHGTLVANTKATGTVTAPPDKARTGRATLDKKIRAVRVTNHGTVIAVIYATVSGTDPTVKGNDTYAIGPGAELDIDLPAPVESAAVEMISSGATDWSLEAIS